YPGLNPAFSVRRDNFLLARRCLSAAATAMGVLLLAIAAAATFEGWFYQWSGRRELSTLWEPAQAVHAAVPPSGSLARERQPERGETLGMLEVPRLKLSVVVLEGSDDGVLKKGPGHIEDTAYPGELGNVAIAGHRDTHFRPLRHIRLNDEVILRSKKTTMRYFIDSLNIVPPTEMQTLDP